MTMSQEIFEIAMMIEDATEGHFEADVYSRPTIQAPAMPMDDFSDTPTVVCAAWTDDAPTREFTALAA